MSAETTDYITLGRITSVHGVKGWVKVYSDTEPSENIFQYQSLFLQKTGSSIRSIKVAAWRRQGKGLVAQIEGYDDRELAKLELCGRDVVVSQEELQELPVGEYYWRQLEGLTVLNDYEGQADVHLGVVHHLIETGSNDVLVVRATEDSIDDRERLIPYLPETEFIQSIDLEAGEIRVSWDPEF